MALSLPAYSSKSDVPKQAFTASTYEGVGAGLDDEIKVSVIFSDTETTDIKATESNDTRVVSDPALEIMPQRIINAQPLAVGAVSYTIFTSKGVVEPANKPADRQNYPAVLSQRWDQIYRKTTDINFLLTITRLTTTHRKIHRKRKMKQTVMQFVQ